VAAPHLNGRAVIQMTITFKNDNDIIVYALEKIISYAGKTEQIFVAQCIWWLASIIGLEQGLTIYIDHLRARAEIVSVRKGPVTTKAISVVKSTNRQDRILKECEEYV
jgi:hypothetical protein